MHRVSTTPTTPNGAVNGACANLSTVQCDGAIVNGEDVDFVRQNGAS
jgi:hypothetical protein